MSNSLSKEAKAALAGIGLTATGATFAAGKIASTKKKGLRAPTAKTAEKVTNRALQRHHSSHGFVMSKEVEHPKRVAARTFNAFQKKYPQALDARLDKEQANIKKINKKMGKNLVDDLLGKPSIATKLAKITKSVTPFGVAASVMSPTKIGDATMDGKKYKYDSSKLPKLKR